MSDLSSININAFVDKFFMREYEESDSNEVVVIKIINVDTTDNKLLTKTVRDDQRPKRVGGKTRSISIKSLMANWKECTEEESLSPEEIAQRTISKASKILQDTTGLPKSQSDAITTIMYETMRDGLRQGLNFKTDKK